MPLNRHAAEKSDERAARPYRSMTMDPIGRKHLPHDRGPLNPTNPEADVYFITICCLPRGHNQLAHPDVWQSIYETLGHRESAGAITCQIALAMPDHFHALIAFQEPMKPTVSAFKAWLAKRHGIRWQRDFFDHRLRSHESAAEKAIYVRMNPVRAELFTNPQDWPYQR